MAKSARELANRSRNAFARPGADRGSVTAKKVPRRDLPRLSDASSRLGSIAASTADRVRKATGKTVRVSDSQVPQKPKMLN